LRPCWGAPWLVPLPPPTRGLSGRERVTELQLGAGHVLARTDVGRLLSWGANHRGQLGVGDTIHRYEPVAIDSLDCAGVSQVFTHGDESYAIIVGTAYAWGACAGTLVAGRHIDVLCPQPFAALPARGIRRLEAQPGGTLTAYPNAAICSGSGRGAQHLPDGAEAAVEGDNAFEALHANGERHQVGFWIWGVWGDHEIDVPFQPWVTSDVRGLAVRQVAVAPSYFVVLWESGGLASWGKDKEGLLGLGDHRSYCSRARAIDLPPSCNHEGRAPSVIALQQGRSHFVVLTSSGLICTWGANSAGQLGLGDVESRSQPTEVQALRGKRVVQVVAVRDASYALTEEGVVHAWGDNCDGALGASGSIAAVAPKLLVPEAMGLRGGAVRRLEVLPSPAIA